MNVPRGVSLDVQVTHAPSSGLSCRASGSPHGGRSWLAWDSGIRFGREDAPSLLLHHPTVMSGRKTWGLAWWATTQQPLGLGKGYLEGVRDAPGQAHSQEANKVHSGVPQTWGPQTGTPTARLYLKPLPQGRASPDWLFGPSWALWWPLNKAVPNVFIVCK